ncbi:MotA/TolQ/ExbB proton channel family protein [Campylobacter sputorum]|uniref:MotA/TolQ/ExbB proton channel family protein n=1 Tax=Campylobacter sputorum TaxID=206 RepID=UPI00053BE534|nr:MotA/TolQ/ExbB proton channel family protein [Campylobacter sputorum]
MLELMKVGGIFMWPIFCLAVFALAIVLEKIYFYTFINSDLSYKFKYKLSNLISNKSINEITEYCQNFKNPVAKTTISILQNYPNSLNELEYNIEVSQKTWSEQFEKGGWILGLCVGAAPQLGLLGTVVGMIKSFGALSIQNNAIQVANGISEALYTTAFGLLVAIPALMIHIAINKKNDKILDDMEKISMLIYKRFKNEICK